MSLVSTSSATALHQTDMGFAGGRSGTKSGPSWDQAGTKFATPPGLPVTREVRLG